MKQSFFERANRVVDFQLPFAVPDSPETARTLSQQIGYLLSASHQILPGAQQVLEQLQAGLSDTLRAAFLAAQPDALLEVHKALYAIYEISFCNPLAPAAQHENSIWLLQIRNAIEQAWLEFELRGIESELPNAAAISQPEQLCAFLTAQARKASALDQKVLSYLQQEATLEQFKLFVLSDGYLNYRFYDALALAQRHYSEAVKCEISHHMWDECGQGVREQAHTWKFTCSLEAMGLTQPQIPIWEDWRPYAGHNLYFLFGLSRRHYFKALGSLAMPELFDPDRDRAVVAGLERLFVDARERFEYYYDHIEADEGHGTSWLGNVITPIALAQPEAALDIAIGGALRMVAMRRYNEYLDDKFAALQTSGGAR